MRRVVLGLVVALLLSLSGCGGNTVDDYCKDLGEHRKQMADMVASQSPTALLSHLPMLRELAEKAPEDLKDEWQTFLDAVEGLDKAIDRAGVKASDFKDGQPPAGLSATDQKTDRRRRRGDPHRRGGAGRLGHRAAGTRRVQDQLRPLRGPCER